MTAVLWIYIVGAIVSALSGGAARPYPSRDDLFPLVLFTVFWPVVAVAALGCAVFGDD